MSLPTGTRLGTYVVEELTGAGGMGEVYRGRDTKLHRSVALKVLPEAFAIDPERIARFRREAQVLASLNHPHIAQIYGFEDAGSAHALVMEFVEGDTLAERLSHGPMPIGEALRAAKQIAEALEAAHERGVVHRDLKPSNIKLRPDGTIKVLDFGLAKALDSTSGSSGDPGSLPTITAPLTQLGVVLGTAAYMSPEQTRGADVDKRSDIWAFGCVLYEMLTAGRAFSGKTMSDTIAAVLEREPDWTRVPAAAPSGVARLLRRALEKDPKKRLHDIADARIEIDDALNGTDGAMSRVRSSRRAVLIKISVVIVFAAALASVYLARQASVVETNAYRFVPFAAEESAETSPAWSPDGRSIAYVAAVDAVRQVFIRSLDSAVRTQITKSSTDCEDPFWSPDGSLLYYHSAGNLWSVGAAGGQSRVVQQSAPAADVAPDGRTIAFMRGSGGNRTLWIVAGPGSEPAQYRRPPFPEKFTRSDSIDFSPDGSKIAVLVEQVTGAALTFELWILPYPSGQPRIALGPVLLSRPPVGWRRISWTSDNRHIVLQNEVHDKPGSHLHVIDTDKGTIRPVTAGTGEEWTPSVSPDGTRIAFTSGTNDFDLAQISLDRGEVQPLLATGRTERTPSWSPAGTRFAYVTNMTGRAELWLRSVQEEWSSPVLKRDAEGLPVWYNVERPTFSPDGQKVAYGVILDARHAIWISSVAGGRPVPIDLESADQHGASWSPDGNWIAYHRLHAGQWELVKAPLVSGKAVRLGEALAGGGDTAWSPTGEWLALARTQAVELVSADGAIHKMLRNSAADAFGFSRDGTLLYLVRRDAKRNWEVAAFDVGSGAEIKGLPLNVPAAATLSGFSLHPNGKSFITSIGTARFDIWFLEGFQPPASRWFR